MNGQLLKHLLRSVVGNDLYPVLSQARAEWERRRRDARVRERNERLIRELLARREPIKLDLGAGENRGLKGWTTVDANGECDLCLDLAKPLPFPDESVSAIYSSHLLEHLGYPHPLKDLLRECWRILKRDGLISVAVPNARPFLEAYAGASDFRQEILCTYDTGLSYKARIDFVNYIAYMGGHHRHMFDEESLVVALSEAGFREVCRREFDAELDLPARQHESIYALGRK